MKTLMGFLLFKSFIMSVKKCKENTCFKTWLDDDGICVSFVKPGAEITIAEAKENSDFVALFGE